MTLNGKKTWKFKHMLTVIVHLKQQKMVKVILLKQHFARMSTCSLK